MVCTFPFPFRMYLSQSLSLEHGKLPLQPKQALQLSVDLTLVHPTLCASARRQFSLPPLLICRKLDTRCLRKTHQMLGRCRYRNYVISDAVFGLRLFNESNRDYQTRRQVSRRRDRSGSSFPVASRPISLRTILGHEFPPTAMIANGFGSMSVSPVHYLATVSRNIQRN